MEKKNAKNAQVVNSKETAAEVEMNEVLDLNQGETSKPKSINKVVLNGFVGMDPEIHRFENGRLVARFTLATHENYKTREGEWVRITTWHPVVMWNNMAETALGYIRKGNQVELHGRVSLRSFVDKSGQKRTRYEVLANEMQSVLA